MPRGHPGKKMRLISIHLTEEAVEELDWLVQKGLYPSKSEAIRAAVITFLANVERPKAEKEREEEEDGLHVLRGRW